ncbi:YggS family pyridoxal phosphate-dependent enzyme [Ignavigranum ruoffiae]
MSVSLLCQQKIKYRKDLSMSSLADNYRHLKERIQQISQQYQQKTPTLICVSKTANLDQMEELYQLGVRDFAENRPQVFQDKYQHFAHSDVIWHYIGSLQRRPVKDIINQVDYFHALDRLKLAKEIQKRADRPIKSFVQVNISGEASKSGLNPHELVDFLNAIKDFDKILPIGLMTMAPKGASTESCLEIFQALRNLRDQIQQNDPSQSSLTELSMGMSADFVPAIQAGTSFLRIGSAFFAE